MSTPESENIKGYTELEVYLIKSDEELRKKYKTFLLESINAKIKSLRNTKPKTETGGNIAIARRDVF